MIAAPAPPDPAAEDALISLSALQHHLFCPRQCALIHVERLWAEDVATAEGRLLHERADAGGGENRPGVRVARGLALRSFALRVSGKADVVEFHQAGPQASTRPFPVEYKRGKPKAHRADEVQLCAQAICLEEMFGTSVPEGALFYGVTRRRLAVSFDDDLRLCLDHGQRVQYSVFECEVEPAQWAALRARLVDEIDRATDSLRFYRLGAEGHRRIEHVGAKPVLDLDSPLVF